MIGQVYLNGRWLDPAQATISPLDRGFLFADGVYEVIPVVNGRLFGGEEHITRLQHSLDAIDLPLPHGADFWRDLATQFATQLVQANQPQGAIYLQVSRGAGEKRDHAFPAATVPATIFAYSFAVAAAQTTPARAITVADQRWARCDIKSISLLPNVLARQQAVAQGCDEAIFIKDQMALEGAAMNLFVIVDGVLRTAPADHQILGGITRKLLLEMLADDPHIQVEEKAVGQAELARAEEVFLTSSTKDLLAVGMLDNQPVGDTAEKPGPLTTYLQERFAEYKRLKTG